MAEEKRRLLVVEDDVGLQKQLKWAFDEYEVLQATSRESAIGQLRRYEPPVVLQDLGLPPDPEGVEEGFATLREILVLLPQTKVIVVTGHADRDNAIKAIGAGACDFCQKPLDLDILRLIVERAFHVQALEEQNRALREGQAGAPLAGVIATDDRMLKVCRSVEKVAPTDATVLILGESGTGKELIARGVHDLSRRHKGRFVAINCAAIPENLLESELFGYEKGAFTGAVRTTQGKFELADGGTLFLDEIGDLDLGMQAKLLRVLQERTFRRVGGTEDIAVDFRLIAAPNRDLQKELAHGAIREDL
ncbi:MAG: sigma 54-interacting transcriptional regulator [Gammaproteobacteria bacterium]